MKRAAMGRVTRKILNLIELAITILVPIWRWQFLNTFDGCMDACTLFRSAGVSFDGGLGGCLSVTWTSTGLGFDNCWMKNVTALAGSNIKTTIKIHAVPVNNVVTQSAGIVGA
jgi:hypothetical protein